MFNYDLGVLTRFTLNLFLLFYPPNPQRGSYEEKKGYRFNR